MVAFRCAPCVSFNDRSFTICRANARFQANPLSSSDAFCRSSKGLDRVAFFDARGLFSIPAVLVMETDPLPCCWPIASGIASSSSSRTSICELSFRCEPGCDPRSRCLSQMLHLVLAYALPLTSTCSCILSQAVRLNGLLVVSRFGRFPGRSTLCFDFCSDVFFGFRSFASVP